MKHATVRFKQALSPKSSSTRAALKFLAVGLFFLATTALHAQGRKAVSKTPPVYPALAKQMHIGGVIRVSATVDASGNVVKAESDSPNKMLVSAAVDAVKKWKFAPGDANETVVVEVNFEASN